MDILLAIRKRLENFSKRCASQPAVKPEKTVEYFYSNLEQLTIIMKELQKSQILQLMFFPALATFLTTQTTILFRLPMFRY